ncbi:MAG: cytochrome P450 [Propionibacterium sp.]|nr:cytochrome P450 [Propionibacterium sp.]
MRVAGFGSSEPARVGSSIGEGGSRRDRQGYGNAEILVECVTYGTAGMVTTREFISMACWHLLTHPELAARYRAAEQQERLASLAEIIRLEPVVGHLYRRMQQPVTVTDAGRRHTLSPGDLVDICVRQANTDPDTAGAQPHDLCPGRDMPGADASGLSFGDGAHKCPGRPLALLESDVLLTKLLGHRPRIVREPRLGWDDLVAGYTLRDFELAFDAPA